MCYLCLEPVPLRRETVRRFALEVCAKFGISVSRVNPAFLDSMETICADYIRSQAIASVKDGQKTVGGGLKNEL